MRSIMMNFRASGAEHALLNQIAAQHNLTNSDLVRRFVVPGLHQVAAGAPLPPPLPAIPRQRMQRQRRRRGMAVA